MTESLNAALGAAIRRKRVAVGMSQAGLAEALALSRTSVTNIEGGRQPLSVPGLYQVARVLGVPVHELLPDDPGAPSVRGRRSRDVKSLLHLLEPLAADPRV